DVDHAVGVEADVRVERRGGAEGVQHHAGERRRLAVGRDGGIGADRGGAGRVGGQEAAGGGAARQQRGVERGAVLARDRDVGGAGARQPRGHAGRVGDRDGAGIEQDRVRAAAHATVGEELLAGRRADVDDGGAGSRGHGDRDTLRGGVDGLGEARAGELDTGGRIEHRTDQRDTAARAQGAEAVDGHAGDGEAFTHLGAGGGGNDADHELGVAVSTGAGDQRGRGRTTGRGDRRRGLDGAGGELHADVVAHGAAQVVVGGGGADGRGRHGGDHGVADELVRVFNRGRGGHVSGKGSRRSKRSGNGQGKQFVLRHVELTPFLAI